MAEKFDIKRFVRKLKNFIMNLIKLVRTADKRTLIISVAGVVLALVLIIVLIASVAGGKEDETANDSPVSSDSYIKEEGTTDDEASINSVQLNGAGNYIVTTGNNSPLNMRPTAGTDYSVMATIPNGTRVNVLFVDDSESSTAEKGWGYIEYNGKRGWVSMDYLTATE